MCVLAETIVKDLSRRVLVCLPQMILVKANTKLRFPKQV